MAQDGTAEDSYQSRLRTPQAISFLTSPGVFSEVPCLVLRAPGRLHMGIVERWRDFSGIGKAASGPELPTLHVFFFSHEAPPRGKLWEEKQKIRGCSAANVPWVLSTHTLQVFSTHTSEVFTHSL